jgi:hypothetical protein
MAPVRRLTIPARGGIAIEEKKPITSIWEKSGCTRSQSYALSLRCASAPISHAGEPREVQTGQKRARMVTLTIFVLFI